MTESRDTDRNYEASRRPDLVLNPAKDDGNGEKVDVVVMGLGKLFTIEVNLDRMQRQVEFTIFSHADLAFIEHDKRVYLPEEHER